MNRVKPSFGSDADVGQRRGAMAIMWRARSSKPRTSPGV